MAVKLRESMDQVIQVLSRSEDAGSFGYRALSVLLSISFFAVYSRVVFLLFMGGEGFYSYDLFANGSIGVNVFFFITEFAVILISVSMFGILIPLLGRFVFGGKPGFVSYLVLGVSNLFTGLVTFPAIIRSGEQSWMAWFLIGVLSILVCLQIAALMYASAMRSLKSLAAVLVLVSGVTFAAHGQVASLLKIGLHYFGVGGDVPVAIEVDRPGDKRTLTGKLVFMSPENIYVIFDGEKGISIVDRSKAEVVSVFSVGGAS